MKSPDTDHQREWIREENQRIRRESGLLLERARRARDRSQVRSTAGGDDLTADRGFATGAWVSPVPVCDLFTILVDVHRLGVMDAVHGLAVQLSALGYPEEADHVDAADALLIPAAILKWMRR